MLDTFPETPQEELPNFDRNGVLPPGDYAPSQRDFEQRFVNAGDQLTRQSIYDGWNRHRQALARDGLAPSARQLLNGSFTTSKNAPGDIDIAVEVPVDGNTLLSLNGSSPIIRLLQGPNMKADYECDAYPILTLPKGHIYYERITVEAIKYWTKWFGQTRQGIIKGRVWATIGGLK